MPLKKILVLVDRPERFSPALQRATALARQTGATVHLCVVEYNAAVAAVGYFSQTVSDLARQTLLADSHRQLQARIDALDAEPVQVGGEVLWGWPPQEPMLAAVRRLQPDLVIKDIELEPILKRLVLTPVDWHLLRDCPAPLMLVNPQSRPLPTRLLAAVEPLAAEHSGGGLNDAILGQARDLAGLAKAKLELLFVVQDLPGTGTAGADSSLLAESYARLREARLERFRVFADVHQVPREQRTVLYGAPWAALSDHAVDPAGDLLVLGTVTRQGVERWILGSTAERIASLASCDLLALKPAPAAIG